VMTLTVVTAVILSSTCSAFKQIAILRRMNFVEKGSVVVERFNNRRGTLLRGYKSEQTPKQSQSVVRTLDPYDSELNCVDNAFS